VVSTAAAAQRRPRRARQQRSLATEARIVAAATELFLREGYAATTMAAIASLAGVSVQSLYLRFGGKLDILAAALDVAIVGDAEPVPLLERPWFREVQELDDGPAAVRVFVAEVAAIMVRSYPLYQVVLGAGDEARDLLRTNKRQRYDGVRAVTEALATKHSFAANITTDDAAARLYALLSEEQYGLLVAERGWSSGAWQSWTTELVSGSLFPSAAGAARSP
jgi:AcrR family transcriptional regulator